MSLRNPNSERAGQVQFNGEWGPVPSSVSRVTEVAVAVTLLSMHL